MTHLENLLAAYNDLELLSDVYHDGWAAPEGPKREPWQAAWEQFRAAINGLDNGTVANTIYVLTFFELGETVGRCVFSDREDAVLFANEHKGEGTWEIETFEMEPVLD